MRGSFINMNNHCLSSQGKGVEGSAVVFSPSSQIVLLMALGFVSSLKGAQVPLWELGSNPGLVGAAWQSTINGSGNATVSAEGWNLSSTGSYKGVQVGVAVATPALAADDRLALTVKKGTVGKRIVRRAAGKVTGPGLGRLFR